MDKQTLLRAAIDARQNAYAPYSHFTVGAAVLTDEGSVYSGCNIENASFGETCCAERVAMFKAISEGAKRFVAIAVVGASEGEEPTIACTPCGSCRQVMAQFATDECAILSVGYETTLGELLPNAFRL